MLPGRNWPMKWQADRHRSPSPIQSPASHPSRTSEQRRSIPPPILCTEGSDYRSRLVVVLAVSTAKSKSPKTLAAQHDSLRRGSSGARPLLASAVGGAGLAQRAVDGVDGSGGDAGGARGPGEAGAARGARAAAGPRQRARPPLPVPPRPPHA
jgi:hypothetical protein